MTATPQTSFSTAVAPLASLNPLYISARFFTATFRITTTSKHGSKKRRKHLARCETAFSAPPTYQKDSRARFTREACSRCCCTDANLGALRLRQ